MKEITRQWLDFAETDLLTCEKLLNDKFLTNIVAYHSQQVVEKCFKAIIEEKNLILPHIHSLVRLYGTIQSIIDFEIDNKQLQIADSIYTISRYPTDVGLTPDGKPSLEKINIFYSFVKYINGKTIELVNK